MGYCHILSFKILNLFADKFLCLCSSHGSFICSQVTCMMRHCRSAFILLVLGWCWIWYILLTLFFWFLTDFFLYGALSSLYIWYWCVISASVLNLWELGGAYIWKRCWPTVYGWSTDSVGMSYDVTFMLDYPGVDFVDICLPFGHWLLLSIYFQ